MSNVKQQEERGIKNELLLTPNSHLIPRETRFIQSYRHVVVCLHVPRTQMHSRKLIVVFYQKRHNVAVAAGGFPSLE